MSITNTNGLPHIWNIGAAAQTLFQVYDVSDIANIVRVILGDAPTVGESGTYIIYEDPLDNNDKKVSLTPTGYVKYIFDAKKSNVIDVSDIANIVDVILAVTDEEKTAARAAISNGQPRHPGLPTGITYDSANSPKELVLNFPRQLRDLTSNEATIFPSSTFYNELKTCFKIYADNSGSVGDILDPQPVFTVSITNDTSANTGKLTITLDAQPDSETKYWIVYTGKFKSGKPHCPTDDSLLYKEFNTLTSGIINVGILIDNFQAGPYIVPAGAANVAGPGAAVVMTVTINSNNKYVIRDASNTEFTNSISLLHKTFEFDFTNATGFQIKDGNTLFGSVSGSKQTITVNSLTPTLYYSDSTAANTGGVIYTLPPWLGHPKTTQ